MHRGQRAASPPLRASISQMETGTHTSRPRRDELSYAAIAGGPGRPGASQGVPEACPVSPLPNGTRVTMQGP